MKAVLDTNVIVSALVTAEGTCSQVLELMIAGIFQPCVDGRILAEYERVLRYPRLRIEFAQAREFLDFVHSIAEPIAALPLRIVLPDEDDLPFLEVAATAEAILVTGNFSHFPKKSCKGVMVVPPREFLDIVHKAM